MNNKDFFHIRTLSDCKDCGDKQQRRRLSGLSDPVSVILATTAIIQSILGIFTGRHRLTNQDWQTLFPSNGNWTNQLRSYLAAHINYIEDYQKYALQVTKDFVFDNSYAICGRPNKATVEGNYPTYSSCLSKFYELLQTESTNSPGTPGGYGTAGMEGILPIVLVGAALWFFTSQSKKKRTKK